MSARKHTLDSDEDEPTPTKCQFTDHQAQLEEHGKQRGPEVMKMMDEEAVRIMLSQGVLPEELSRPVPLRGGHRLPFASL